MLREGYTFQIGSGHTNILHSPWLLQQRLGEVVSYIDIHDAHLYIKDIWNNSLSSWDLEQLYTVIPQHVLNLFNHIKPRLVQDVTDVWCRSANINGIYMARSGYH